MSLLHRHRLMTLLPSRHRSIYPFCKYTIVSALSRHRTRSRHPHHTITLSSSHCRVTATSNQTSIVQWCDREQYGSKHITYIIDTNRKILPPGTENIYLRPLIVVTYLVRLFNLNDPRSKYSVDCNLCFWHRLHGSLLNKFS